MVKDKLDLDYIPEDVLKEVLEAEKKEFKRYKKKRKAHYPTSRVLVQTIIELSYTCRGIHPHEFPRLILDYLERKGFDTRYITIKRIWNVYESLVKRHVITDVFGVVE